MAPVSVTEARSKPYDVIIVGGGTAGLVVAARLCEISNKTAVATRILIFQVFSLEFVAIRNMIGTFGRCPR